MNRHRILWSGGDERLDLLDGDCELRPNNVLVLSLVGIGTTGTTRYNSPSSWLMIESTGTGGAWKELGGSDLNLDVRVSGKSEAVQSFRVPQGGRLIQKRSRATFHIDDTSAVLSILITRLTSQTLFRYNPAYWDTFLTWKWE